MPCRFSLQEKKRKDYILHIYGRIQPKEKVHLDLHDTTMPRSMISGPVGLMAMRGRHVYRPAGRLPIKRTYMQYIIIL